MTDLLQDNVVIVTGAGAGIGYGILRAAIEAGARVTGFDIDPKARARITDAGARFLDVDVGDVDALQAAIAAVRKTEGRLDGLVNNAGLTLTAPFLEADPTLWERLWQVNQQAVLVGCQAAARIMAADGKGGAIVNIASNHARASDAGYEAYAGTKGAIVAMTRAMAWSLGPQGIRVNALCPGLTMTETVATAAETRSLEARFRAWHADGEVSSVEEIGRVAVFLLSPSAAAINGADILADRAMSARLGDLEG